MILHVVQRSLHVVDAGEALSHSREGGVVESGRVEGGGGDGGGGEGGGAEGSSGGEGLPQAMLLGGGECGERSPMGARGSSSAPGRRCSYRSKN